ncbi:SRPBCC family protein [Cellulomonas wangsupingiae]|uniref:SRPBCC family protein n=1 Tax=Cellulomonas wangsupingiae TaxID=2968085 RepID=A0ABY5K436_9CELL|nr:SRPBCC family protein [Cellulomonas wangsupingiae]MCC2333732.1 SRPBCC family protein [Cellulomonas wangsupingiae]MCM0639449.1 SRPBCC family protein [Cellulomonas wangsupingiae]UUI64994.1 SRPBCC family protein [Cellulomonas wangsupingiae]
MTGIDALEQAGLVARELHRGERGDAPTKIAVARRLYRAAPDDVWDALTDPERLPRWFAPVTGDLREGGRYQVEGNAGGVVEECRQPERFSLTWEMGDQVSWVEVLLAPADGGTELTLRHEAHVDPQFWEQFGPGAVGVGWDLALWGLAAHLATGEAIAQGVGEEWPTTPEGQAFVRRAADGWAQADAADGREPASAEAAGQRTFAFYTGTAAPEA